MLKLIDRLYLYFYWCWNIDKNGSLKDVTLSKDIMLWIWGILFIILSPTFHFLPFKLSTLGLFIIVGAVAFVLSGLIMRKYNNERKNRILNKFDKPGKVKYIVFVLFTVASVLISISSFFIGSRIIEYIKYNR